MKCGRHARTTGQPCRNERMRGATVCRMHAGAAPQVRAAAARRTLEADARQVWARMDHEPVDDPMGALMQLAGDGWAWYEHIKGIVGDLTSLSYPGIAAEQIRGPVELLTRAMDQLTRMLTAIARLNIDERLADIEKAKADALAAAVEAAIAEVGLPPADARRAKLAIVRHLRPVEDGDAA